MKNFFKSTIILSVTAILGVYPLLMCGKVLGIQPTQVQPELTNQASSFKLPTPSGAYQVSTTAYYLIDSSRKETYKSEIYDLTTRKLITNPPPTNRRELMVSVWYPAVSKSILKTAPYVDEGFALATADGFAPNLGVSPDKFTQLITRIIQTNAIPKASIANALKRYPVVIFSPGFGSTPRFYTNQIEQLASHGYVVVAINPTYEAPILFPGGRVITQSTIFNFSKANQTKIDSTFNEAVKIRAKDVSFVLDELARINRKDSQGIFTGRLDLNRVGIMGHSLGGDTAIEAMWRDGRIKAGINMDGGSYGTLLSSKNKSSLNRPFLVMSHDGADNALQLFYQRQKANAYRLTLRGSKHNTFMDFGLILPAFKAHSTAQSKSQIEQSIGSIKPQRAANIISAYTLAFFNQYLKGKNETLLKTPSPNYPEVVIESRNKHYF
ncbi:carboxylic ester hydrolase [Rivularia sp. IAM M-261]|nr:carboxylic ester hydrolase [Rivularia sp. IAM M-261]